MGFATVDAVYLTLAFLTPGLIIVYIRSQFITGRIPKPNEQVFTYLALSGLNYGLFSWLIYGVVYSEWFKSHPWASALAWFFFIFLAPAFIGIFFAYSVQRDWAGQIFRKIGLHPVNVWPTSWDRKFCYQRAHCFLTVTLKDGTTVSGYYGGDSFASSEPAERDIFIEQIYDMEEKGQWKERAAGHGILIMHSEIRCVEFHPSGESSDDREEAASPVGEGTSEKNLRPRQIDAGQLPADQERSEA